MIEVEKKEIGRHTYSVEQLGAKQGRRVFARVLRALGPAIEKIDGGNVEASIVQAVAALVQQLSEDDFDYLCETFSKKTRVALDGGKEPLLSDVFDVHFAGDYGELVAWLVFALQVNFFNDRFLAGSGLGDLVSRVTETPSESPST